MLLFKIMTFFVTNFSYRERERRVKRSLYPKKGKNAFKMLEGWISFSLVRS